MGLQKGWCASILCVLCFFSFIFFVLCDEASINEGEVVEGNVSIDGRIPIAKTDDNFVCATMDLWPPTKCDYGYCPWGKSSILNVDLNNNILKNAVKAFSPLRLRLGGTLQDRLIYQTEKKEACNSTFVPDENRILNFRRACLPLDRWDEINSFILEAGAEAVFGLNALRGKTVEIKEITTPSGELDETTTATGDWDYSNSKFLIEYTLRKGYKIHGWTLGNELGGHTLFIGVPPEPYAQDTKDLHKLLAEIHDDINFKPLIIAPGALFDETWFQDYIEKTPEHLDVATHHIYNLGSGNDDDLVEKILKASYLETTIKTFSTLQNIIKAANTPTVAWVGESGGAFNSGKDGITNAFVYSFWYMNMLGLASTYETKTYCRQTLIGGNYGLLDTNTYIPNPDYYSALLFHRLMGKNVLSTKIEGTENVHVYAHCANKSPGITILVINPNGNTTVKVKLDYEKFGRRREEYHLTPMDNDILSRSVMLNGKQLTVDPTGAIPALKPVVVENPSDPITVYPYSIAFVHMPLAYTLPACNTS